MFYQNRVWLQGRASSAPRMMELGSRKKVTSFTLSVVESWDDLGGEHKERKSSFWVEVVGRDAQRVFDSVRMGTWASVDGYLRSESIRGETATKVRVYAIKLWEEPRAEPRTVAPPGEPDGRDHTGGSQ